MRANVLIAAAILTVGSAAAAPTAARSATAAACKIMVYPPAGRPSAHARLGGPGLVLSGAGFLGMPYPDVLRWMRAQMLPKEERTGNLLVLQASGENDYTQAFFKTNTFASVREILIPACAPRGAVDGIAHYADTADAVLFAGGDQSHYVAWKGSALIGAVKRVYPLGGVIGGGSAGLAIQGAVVYDSVAADRVLPNDENLGSARATRDPYGPAVSRTSDFFSWPPLAGTITDSHFARRDRFGRLTALIARALHDRLVPGPHVYGLGIDEGSVLIVDHRGVATLRVLADKEYRTRGAYLLEGGAARQIARGKPLHYAVRVMHISRPGQQLDLLRHTGTGVSYTVTIDGAATPIYSRTPY